MQKLYHVTFKASLATAQQLLVRPERVLCFLPSYKLCCDSTEAMMSGNGWGKMTVSSGYILKTLFLRDTAFAAYLIAWSSPFHVFPLQAFSAFLQKGWNSPVRSLKVKLPFSVSARTSNYTHAF
jgi:hypothetical protein